MLKFSSFCIILGLTCSDPTISRFQDTNSRFLIFSKFLCFNFKFRWVFEPNKGKPICEDSEFCYAVENDECNYQIAPIRENFGAKITGLNLG